MYIQLFDKKNIPVSDKSLAIKWKHFKDWYGEVWQQFTNRIVYFSFNVAF